MESTYYLNYFNNDYQKNKQIYSNNNYRKFLVKNTNQLIESNNFQYEKQSFKYKKVTK
uniref:Uncharacterized protein n=1 Tax=Florenciella sp. virus SA2 TaxID=3240092 RepID=A0AB39JD19_9VIRU